MFGEQFRGDARARAQRHDHADAGEIARMSDITPDPIIKTAKTILGFAAWRFGMALLVGSGIILGGVYFIVETSVGSLRHSIDLTNKRMDDLKNSLEVRDSNLKEHLNLRIENVQLSMRSEFAHTRQVVRDQVLQSRSADIDLYFNDPDADDFVQRNLTKDLYRTLIVALKQSSLKFGSVYVFPFVTNPEIERYGMDLVGSIIITNRTELELDSINKIYPNCVSELINKGFQRVINIGYNGIRVSPTAVACSVVDWVSAREYWLNSSRTRKP